MIGLAVLRFHFDLLVVVVVSSRLTTWGWCERDC